MPTYKPITLKMSTAPAYGYTSIKQMDVEGVELILTLKNTDDSDYNLTSGSTLFFKMANESGNVKVTLSEMDSPSNITRDGANVVRVLLTESMVSETGIMACELQEMHSGTFTSSQLFYLRVWPTTEDGEIIDSHEYKSLVSAYLAIDNALNVATLAKNYSDSTITEENARQAAELLRKQAENDRVLAENDRVLAESARVAAENLRGIEVANARGDHATLGDRLDEMDVGIEGNTSEVENTKLKVIRLEQEVKRYKELYEQSNPTQSPRVSSEGYGVVSLPKNAANGQVSDVVIKGLTATNLVENGDFSNGITGWTSSTANISVASNKMRVLTTATTSSHYTKYDIPVAPIAGHKYYVVMRISDLVTSQAGFAVYNRKTDGSYENVSTGSKNVSGIYSVIFAVTNVYATPEFYIRANLYDATGASSFTGTTEEAKFSYVMAIDLTAKFGSGSEPTAEQCDKIFANWFDGTKSTVGAMRLKSVSADETETSTAYVVAKDEEGKIIELRSLPNGTKDEIRVSEGKLIKRVSDDEGDKIKFATSWTALSELTNTIIFYKALKTLGLFNVQLPATGNDTANASLTIGGIPFPVKTQLELDVSDVEGFNINFNSDNLRIRINKSRLSGTTPTAFETWLQSQLSVSFTYQLATPIEKPIQVSGSLVSYPSGTVYIEPFVADAGIYTDKMSVLHQDLPIKALEKISKVDFETGVGTELDVSETVIAGDKLSFTHPDLEAGDIVFFVYEYDRESTVGETEIEYYDSRYVIKDSVTGKFYKWHIAVSEGVPSIELVEV